MAHVRAVDHEDDRVAAAVVFLPHAAQRVLPADVPELEVYRGGVRDCGYILADCGDCVGGWGRMRGQVDGFDLREEGGFAGIVEAKEEDGVFCSSNSSVQSCA